jgi:hypothetical protein
MSTPQNPVLVAIVDDVATKLHAGDRLGAAQVLSAKFGKPAPANSNEATTLLLELFYSLLSSRNYELTARILWDKNVFSTGPQCVQDYMRCIKENSQLLVMGASSMGKSYTACVVLLLEWILDPAYTRVVCLGPKREHVKANVFSTLNRLYNTSTLPLPGKMGDMFIGLDRGDLAGCIQGAVVPKGSQGVALQGVAKLPPRSTPHPVFGKQGRVRIFLDEIEEMNPIIFQELGNLVAGIDASNPDALKIIGAYNPKNINSPVAALAEPEDGWDAFDPDSSYEWMSKRGWKVLRLDGLRSENVLTGTKMYPGLQTVDAINALRLQSGGEDSSAFATFGRGMYPKSGSTTAAIPQTWLNQSLGTVVWRAHPDTAYGIDLSRGGDRTVVVSADVGTISERRWQGWEDEPARRLVFPRSRPCIYVRSVTELNSGDNVETAANVVNFLRASGAKGHNTNLDPGGPGGGAADIVSHSWSRDVMTTWFGGGASSRRIMAEDPKPADEQGYRQTTDEMWGAARRYVEHGFVVFSPDIPAHVRSNLFHQLSNRLWKDSSRVKIEHKGDYKKRNQGRSPDEADALVLAIHLARLRLDFRPSVKDGARESADKAQSGDKPLFSPGDKPKVPPNATIFGDPQAFYDDFRPQEVAAVRADPNYFHDHL